MSFNVCYFGLFFYFITSSYGLKTRVLGGEQLQSQKHLVLLRIYPAIFIYPAAKCSGSIIKPFYIISSAHCFDHDFSNVEVQHMTAGELVHIAFVERKNVKTHEDHSTDEDYDTDLAILRTTQRIQFNKNVRPIKLHSFDIKMDQSAFIAGFGNHDLSEAGTVMTGGTVVVYRCSVRAVCSDGLVIAGAGDSGGSLVYKKRLLGVTSASDDDCLETGRCSTIYASIPANMKWILSKINN